MKTKQLKKTKLSNFVHLPKIKDEGYLSFGEVKRHVPFPIKRVYYIYDVLDGAVRGRHAHKKTRQLLFCIAGSVTIVLDNGQKQEEVHLSDPAHGVLLDTYLWHEMKNFAKGTVLLVLASRKYEAEDYIRNYQEFLHLLTLKSWRQNLRQMFVGIGQSVKGALHI